MRGLLFGVVIGSTLTLAILALAIPARLFGISRPALEYSLSRQTGTLIKPDCNRLGPVRWSCDVLDGQNSVTYEYVVVVSASGCWTATAAGKPRERGCIGLRDYVRIVDRL
jgi:hypothetical protein